MIVKGKIVRILPMAKNTMIELQVPNYQGNWLYDLDLEKEYAFDIKEAKDKKTQNQNKTSWLLMNDIARKDDMYPDPNLIYLRLLKMSKIKTLTLMVIDKELIEEEDLEKGMTEITDEYLTKQLERVYRVVFIHDRYINDKGNNVSTVTVALGMSHFKRHEMASFIDRLLYYAEMVGIDTSQYHFER